MEGNLTALVPVDKNLSLQKFLPVFSSENSENPGNSSIISAHTSGGARVTINLKDATYSLGEGVFSSIASATFDMGSKKSEEISRKIGILNLDILQRQEKIETSIINSQNKNFQTDQ